MNNTITLHTPVGDVTLASNIDPEVAGLLIDAYVKHHDLHDVDATMVDHANDDEYTYVFGTLGWSLN